MALASLGSGADHIVVEASYREKPLMQMIPGARWQAGDQVWKLPLSWGSCLALSGVFGTTLEVGPSLEEWCQPEAKRVARAEEIRNSSHHERYGYQDTGIEFLINAHSALLGDEMGLGKSRQAILAATLPVLVVCPNSMRQTWDDEWAKWRPEASVSVVSGSATKRRKAIEAGSDVTIVNWEAIRTLSRLAPFGSTKLSDKEKTPGPLNRPWGTVIADEAHRAKEAKAKQTRALWAIGAVAERRIALTGTPVANSPEDLWSIMHFVEPGDWPVKSAYIDRYCQAGYNPFGGLDVASFDARTQTELFRILDPRFLRRTKAEVLTELPAKTYQTRYVEMGDKQLKAYRQMAEGMISSLESGTLVATSPLVQLTRLAELASATPTLEGGVVTALGSPSCKIDALLDILDEAPGEALVVFASSRKLIELASSALDKEGITHGLITGAVSSESRSTVVDAFQRGHLQVVLATTGAGSEGITLTRSRRLVFLQRPWSYVQYVQAQDRIHRIGQTEPVQIIDLITANTIEERVLDVLDEKDENLQTVCRDENWLKASLKRSM